MRLARQIPVFAAIAAIYVASLWLAPAFAGQNPADSRQAAPATSGAPDAPHAPVYTVLFNFPGAINASAPVSEAVALGRNGDIYSTTEGGGSIYGTVLSATTAGAVNVVNGSNGYFVVSGVTLGTDGNLYGTDQDGGPGGSACSFFSGGGQVYKVTPAGTLTILHNFAGGASDGCDPMSAPIEGTNGRYYGTTPSNGSGSSTAYSVTSGGVFTNLHTFTAAEGQMIEGGLVQGLDGNFYGVAATGGANTCYGAGTCGTIFRMTPTGTVTVLHNFTGTDGNYAYRHLVQGTDGNFYGTTSSGGTYDGGVVFQITPGGVYTVLHHLDPSSGDGVGPSSSLVQATDGTLYGVTAQGSSGFNGTIYSVTTTGTFTTLYTFTGGTDGDNPASPLIQDTNGTLYGFTNSGGNENVCNSGLACGVFFSLKVGLGPFVALVSTSGVEGAQVGILGQGFNSTSMVTFGGVQATTVALQGTKFISATVPAGALTGSVTVTTGATTLTSNRPFRVAPTIITFSPPSGPVGTPVTITGTGLMQATKVTFNGKRATFTVNSDTQITATVPAGATTGRIVVTTPGGTAMSATNFTVN